MRVNRGTAVGAVMAIAVATFGVVGSVSAASATMRIDPATQTVAQGATFTVKVIENNSVPTLGAQVSITFDRTKAQITAVAWGTSFANAPVLIPSDMAAAIAQANSSGKLSKLAATFLLPTDSVQPGDADVVDITFKATGCGSVALGVPIGPSDASLLDGRDATVGNTLSVTTSGGSVTVCGATAPSSSASSGSGASSGPSSGASPTDSAGASSAAGASSDATPTDTISAVEGASADASSAGSIPPGAASGSTGSGSDGGFPLWLPLALSIPALAIVGLGLLRWRQTATGVRSTQLH